MNIKKTSTFQNGLIWFGAGVSLAEILTGTYFASLGILKGCMAILLGHLIGGIMMYLAGFIGGQTERSAMETVKMSFGQKGGILFAVLNVLQLAGWTAIMIYDGALATNQIFQTGHWIWCLMIGGLILLWIIIGVTNLGILNKIAMGTLFLLTLVLCGVIFFNGGPITANTGNPDEAMSFGAAVELAVAMPLSWLPLISDYTREAEKPTQATLVSVLTYSIVSCWMYFIGMGAAIYTGESDIAQIMAKAGLGMIALVILILSTVTTTFLDAWSAGISAESLLPSNQAQKSHGKLQGKWVALIIAIIGTLAAILFPMDDITDFLYLIGSVFAPMIAIQIADFFFLHRDVFSHAFDIWNLIIWAIGFWLYRFLMRWELPVGYTLIDMILTILLCRIIRRLTKSSEEIGAK